MVATSWKVPFHDLQIANAVERRNIADAIALMVALPVFVDIADDLKIDPESVRRLVTGR